jgi:hypothetical protein
LKGLVQLCFGGDAQAFAPDMQRFHALEIGELRSRGVFAMQETIAFPRGPEARLRTG